MRPATWSNSFCLWLDNFELALKSTGSAEQLRSGVELIVKQMEEILNKMQVPPVATVGQEFDPRMHEALGTVERTDIPDHLVAEEVRRGYQLREKSAAAGAGAGGRESQTDKRMTEGGAGGTDFAHQGRIVLATVQGLRDVYSLKAKI